MVIYALIGLVALDRAGLIAVLPEPIAVVPNALSNSRLERPVMVPVTLALVTASLVIALS